MVPALLESTHSIRPRSICGDRLSGFGYNRLRSWSSPQPPLGEDDSLNEGFPVVGTIDDAPELGHLNGPQRLHLLSSCQYADKLLSEVEAVLVASRSKSPFPKFKPDISPAQAKAVQDYIARMRAEVIRILDSQGVPISEPNVGSVHAIWVTLDFVDICFRRVPPEGHGGIRRSGGRRSLERLCPERPSL